MLCIAVACVTNKIIEWRDIMLGFIIGLFLGAFIGVAVMCLCSVTSKADEDTENYKYAKENKKDE